MIQAELSNQGYVVCATGYLGGEATPEQRAADLTEALTEVGISGPYVLVAAGDGVHPARLFADGNSEVAGVVLVDPVPLGFQDLMDSLFAPDSRSPTWLDLDQAVSDSLDDFGDLPLVVIEGDPEAMFLSENFINGQGRERAETLDNAWAAGLAFYAGLSTDVTSVVADGTGLHMVVWDQPDLVLGQILDVLARAGS